MSRGTVSTSNIDEDRLNRRVAELTGWKEMTLAEWIDQHMDRPPAPHQHERMIWAREDQWSDHPPPFTGGDHRLIEDEIERLDGYMGRSHYHHVNQGHRYDLSTRNGELAGTWQPKRSVAACLAYCAARGEDPEQFVKEES